MQQYIMILHENLSKFRIWHDQNGATGQPQQPTQVLVQICPKQQHGILQPTNQQATAI